MQIFTKGIFFARGTGKISVIIDGYYWKKEKGANFPAGFYLFYIVFVLVEPMLLVIFVDVFHQRTVIDLLTIKIRCHDP